MSLYEQFPDYPEEPDSLEGIPTVTCPSCRGKGELSKTQYQSQSMITFTLLNDQRLKPRRTWFYISVGVAVVAIGSMIAGFFIYPRPMQFSFSTDCRMPFCYNGILQPTSNKIQPQNVTFNITKTWLLYNPSFFPVRLERFDVQMAWSFQPVNKEPVQITNLTKVDIASRSSLNISQQCQINFSGDMGFMEWYCDNYGFYFTTNFQAIANVSSQSLIKMNSINVLQSFQATTCFKRPEQLISRSTTDQPIQVAIRQFFMS